MKETILQTNQEELLQNIQQVIHLELNKFKESLQEKPANQYVGRKKTAQLLGVSLSALDVWTKKGLLPCYKLGRTVKYLRSEIDAFILNRKQA